MNVFKETAAWTPSYGRSSLVSRASAVVSATICLIGLLQCWSSCFANAQVSTNTPVTYSCATSWEGAGQVLSTDNSGPSDCQRKCASSGRCEFFMVRESVHNTPNITCQLMRRYPSTTNLSTKGIRNRDVTTLCAKSTGVWQSLKIPADFTIGRGTLIPAPGTGAWRTVSNSTGIVGIHVNMLPGTDLIMLFARPNFDGINGPQPGFAHPVDPSRVSWASTLVNLTSGASVPIQSTLGPGAPFCAHSALTTRGEVMVCGGDDKFVGYPGEGEWGGAAACRMFTYGGNLAGEWKPMKSMVARHWYPTVVEIPARASRTKGGCFLIVGGIQRDAWNPRPLTTHAEMYCPDDDIMISVPIADLGSSDVQTAAVGLWPDMMLLPIGQPPAAPKFAILHATGGFSATLDMNVAAKTFSFSTTSIFQSLTATSGSMSWEGAAAARMLAVDLAKPVTAADIEMVVFGAQSRKNGRPAGQLVHRLKPLLATQWEVEPMPSGCQMRVAVLLPNGKIVLVNGASYGQVNRGLRPIMTAWLYDPYKPAGQRFTVDPILTSHMRLYHGEAFLGLNGDVYTIGGDSGVHPDQRPGFTMDAYTLPSIRAALANNTRPTIVALDKTRLRYKAVLKVTVAGSRVSRCSLVKPAVVTHGSHPQERVLLLKTYGKPSWNGRTKLGVIRVQMPSTVYQAVPGYWLVYCWRGDVWTEGKWIQLA